MINQKQTYVWLDLVRGISALFVFFSHLRALCFQDYHTIEPSLLAKIFYFLTGFGHQAVIIFFVLSGFFIIRSIHIAHINNKWSSSGYLISRLTRLWVVLFPALFITFLLDKGGFFLFSDSIIYNLGLSTLPEVKPVFNLNLSYLIGNIFFLQTIVVPTFGSNSPLWSLANEFWYYMIFPLLYFSLVPNQNLPYRLILGIAAVMLVLFVGNSIAYGFIVWLTGGLAYYLSSRVGKQPSQLTINTFTVFAILLLLAVLGLIRINLLKDLYGNVALASSTAIFLVFLVKKGSFESSFLKRISDFTSKISYTLYLIHMPIAVFLSAWLIPQRMEWSLENLALYFALSAIILSISWVFWFLFERNTIKIKDNAVSFLQKGKVLKVQLQSKK